MVCGTERTPGKMNKVLIHPTSINHNQSDNEDEKEDGDENVVEQINKRSLASSSVFHPRTGSAHLIFQLSPSIQRVLFMIAVEMIVFTNTPQELPTRIFIF